jgi:osmotically-inducible protein OsmY
MENEGWRGYGSSRSRSGGDYGYSRGMENEGWRGYGSSRSRSSGDYGYDRGMGDYGRSRYGDDYNRTRYGGDYGYNRGRGMGSYGRSRYTDDYDWDTDYDQGFDTYDTWEMDTPTTWTYTEFWLIPGPETGQGPSGYQRSDERIKEDINERLTQHGRLNAANIQVEVDNCNVTLKGTVNNRHMKRMAEDVADSVMGVRDVNNQIKIQDRNQQTTNMQTTGKAVGQTTGRQQQGDNGGQTQTTTTSTSKRK